MKNKKAIGKYVTLDPQQCNNKIEISYKASFIIAYELPFIEAK